MKILQFIWYYYLYIYYWAAKANQDKEEPPNKFKGMVAINLAIWPKYFILLILLMDFDVQWAIYLYENTMTPIAEGTKGPVRPLMFILAFISWITGYLLCCWRVRFSDISDMMNKTSFFKKYSFLKFSFPMAFSYVIFLIVN